MLHAARILFSVSDERGKQGMGGNELIIPVL